MKNKSQHHLPGSRVVDHEPRLKTEEEKTVILTVVTLRLRAGEISPLTGSGFRVTKT